MKKFSSPPLWVDFFDENHFEKTGEALLFRIPYNISEQKSEEGPQSGHLLATATSISYTYNRKPIAMGFTAYIGHDELQPGYNSLKSNLQNGRNFYSRDYYRNYTEHKRSKFLTENEILPKPLSGKTLEICFYSRFVEDEAKSFKASRKYYSVCLNQVDRKLKQRISEYTLQFIDLIQNKLSELKVNCQALEMNEDKSLFDSTQDVSGELHNPPSEENNQPIKGIRALAKFLGVGVNTAQRLKNEGIIPCFQSGNIVLFDQTKVLKALYDFKKQKVKRL